MLKLDPLGYDYHVTWPGRGDGGCGGKCGTKQPRLPRHVVQPPVLLSRPVSILVLHGGAAPQQSSADARPWWAQHPCRELGGRRGGGSSPGKSLGPLVSNTRSGCLRSGGEFCMTILEAVLKFPSVLAPGPLVALSPFPAPQ